MIKNCSDSEYSLTEDEDSEAEETVLNKVVNK